MTKPSAKFAAFCLCFAMAAAAFAADFKAAKVFADRMILQRGVEAPVWGWAEPGAEVAVEFAGQRKSAKAASDGKWLLKLSPMEASYEGRDFKISSGGREIFFKDVLVGEVWLCSGQSNMQFDLSRSEGGPEAVAAAEFPAIRVMNIPNELSSVKLDDFKAPPEKWKSVSKATMGGVSAVGFFFAKELQAKLKVPVGLIVSAWPGSQVITWIPKDSIPKALDDSARMGDESKYIKIWNENDSKTAQKLILEDMEKSQFGYVKHWASEKLYWRILHCFPGWTFNAKLSPLKPYAVRGVLWYQGEDNHAMGMRYSDYLTCMAGAWSKEWGQDLPFFIIFLAPYKYEREGQLPEFWMSQIDAAKKIKGSEVVNTIDIGNATDIHPKKKAPAGERAALAALKKCFGYANSAPGPVLKSADIKGAEVLLLFDNVAEGLKAEGELQGFEIAGKDGKFVPAKAKVSGKGEVVVESAETPSPAFVRYAWSNTPSATLFNSEGLPALPFSTEWNAKHSAASGK